MTAELQDAAFTNAGVLMSFNVDKDDAKLFADRMPDTTIDDFTIQDVGECIVRIHHDTKFVKTELPTLPAYDPTAEIKERMLALNDDGVPEDEDASGTTKVSPSSVKERELLVPVCEGVR